MLWKHFSFICYTNSIENVELFCHVGTCNPPHFASPCLTLASPLPHPCLTPASPLPHPQLNLLALRLRAANLARLIEVRRLARSGILRI